MTHCTQDGARGGAMCVVVVKHGGSVVPVAVQCVEVVLFFGQVEMVLFLGPHENG
jgi:hypothetical protein